MIALRTVFCKGKGHGVEQNRTDVEEMTVKETAAKQYQQRAANKGVFSGHAAQEQPYGLYSVKNIGTQTHQSAAGQKLNHGIVPTGREQRGKAF
jgi:hypothetical protein